MSSTISLDQIITLINECNTLAGRVVTGFYMIDKECEEAITAINHIRERLQALLALLPLSISERIQLLVGNSLQKTSTTTHVWTIMSTTLHLELIRSICLMSDTTPEELGKIFPGLIAARIRTDKRTNKKKAQLAKKRLCSICMDNRADIILHGDVRHKVCETCRIELNICPFCRRVL